jgi:hypothetical protein
MSVNTKDTLKELPKPPEQPPKPFSWSLVDAGNVWTGDASQILALSDPAIVEGMIREREVVQIVGAAKTAKTWFSLALALAVARGGDFLGLPVHKRRVLYLDYELKPDSFTRRLCMLSPDKPEGFHFQTLRGAARLPSIAELGKIVDGEGFGFVVADSLYRTGWIAEENNNDQTSLDLAPLQSFTNDNGCSLAVVDHTAKGGGAGRSSVDASRGASAKGGFFDGILTLRATDKGADPESTYAILDPVLRDWPRFKDLPLVCFEWGAASVSVDLESLVDRTETSTAASKILEALNNASPDPVKAADLASLTETTSTTLRRECDKLIPAKVVKLPDPSHKQRVLYRLADIGDHAKPNQTAPSGED